MSVQVRVTLLLWSGVGGLVLAAAGLVFGIVNRSPLVLFSLVGLVLGSTALLLSRHQVLREP